MPGRIVSLRRYPVKSMGGEALDAVDLDPRGLTGDRWFAVKDEDGHFASGKRTRRFRRHDDVFGYNAMTAADGHVQVARNGGRWRVGDSALNAELSRSLNVPVRVRPERAVPHQDAGSVSLIGTATLRWCAEQFGVDADPRRLRVNIVFESDRPFVEESWLGSTLAIGTARLRIVAVTQRCRMIDIAQDGIAPVRRWLKPLSQHRGLRLGVYADVIAGGRVTVADSVTDELGG